MNCLTNVDIVLGCTQHSPAKSSLLLTFGEPLAKSIGFPCVQYLEKLLDANIFFRLIRGHESRKTTTSSPAKSYKELESQCSISRRHTRHDIMICYDLSSKTITYIPANINNTSHTTLSYILSLCQTIAFSVHNVRLYKVKSDLIRMYSWNFMMTSVTNACHTVPLRIVSRVGTEALKAFLYRNLIREDAKPQADAIIQAKVHTQVLCQM
jgi:hypothetical protein